MREIIARVVCVLTVCVVVGLSLLFASVHNRTATASVGVAAKAAPTSAPASASSSAAERGRAVYAEQNCATCHSIGGEGNPRQSLDGVGARLSAAELRMWITGTGVAAEALPASIARRKQRYRELPAEDLDALVVYLSSVKAAPKSVPK